MGNTQCVSRGSLLLVAAANGDVQAAQEVLRRNPKAALYSNFKDRSSPLIQAAARGHFELLQLIVETAVMVDGPEKAKRNCIDHTNSKRQTALMAACKAGHSDCVEYLVTNGADVLLLDVRRHNTCLHFAALYGHSECVHKLLGCRTSSPDNGRSLPISQLTCPDEDDTLSVKFIDRHNGWGLTALHIAVFQGSVSTVRALLRHGANLEVVIVPSKVEHSPIRCAVGSNALHIAALIGNVVMAKLLLEAQEGYPGLELRTRCDASGLRPQEYAQRARNPVLVHLLDERLPVTLLRQIWMNYSLEQSMPPRHQTLAAMLQKLKLMFSLEIIALQRALDTLGQHQQQQGMATATSVPAGASLLTPAVPVQQQQTGAGAASPGVQGTDASCGGALNKSLRQLKGSGSARLTASNGNGASTAGGALAPAGSALETVLVLKQQYTRQVADVEGLLASVSTLHTGLLGLCRREEGHAEGAQGQWPGGRYPTHEAVLDFILSTLITPRTVSAILHAAKKLVATSVINAPGPSVAGSTASMLGAGSGAAALPPLPPPLASDTEVQHGLALLTTAMRAVETCLQAAAFLANPGSAEAQQAAVAQMQQHQAAQHAQQMAQHEARVQAALALGAPVPAPPPVPLLPPPLAAAGLGQQQQPRTASLAGDAAAAEQGEGGSATAGGAVAAPAQEASSTVGAPEGGTGPSTGGATLAASASAGAASTVAQLPPAMAMLGLPHVMAGAPLPQDPASAAAVQLASALAATTANSAALAAGLGPSFLDQGPMVSAAGMSGGTAGALPTGLPGAAALSPSSSAYTSHWSAHLHTLIAQLQWDIGVQRHRRRRQHAVQQAARNSEQQAAQQQGHGTGAGVAGATTGLVVAVPATSAGSVLPGAAGHRQQGGAGARDAVVGTAASAGTGAHPGEEDAGQGLEAGRGGAAGGPGLLAAPGSITHSISCRRGDAPAEALGRAASSRRSSGGGPSAAAAASSDGALGLGLGGLPGSAAVAATGVSSASAAGVVGTASSRDMAAALREIEDAEEELGELQEDEGEVGDEAGGPGLLGVRAATAQRRASAASARTHCGAGVDRPSAHSGGALAGALQAGSRPVGAIGGLERCDRKGGKKSVGGVNDGLDMEGSAAEGGASSEGSLCSDDDSGVCSICMDLPVAVLVASCHHGLCVQCAFQLTVKGRELPCCPFCRQKISAFELFSPTPAQQPEASVGGASGKQRQWSDMTAAS